MRKDSSWLLTAVLLAACGSSDKTQPPAKPVEDTVFRDLVRAEDKARSVEATTQQRKNEIDAAVQANEGADAAAPAE